MGGVVGAEQPAGMGGEGGGQISGLRPGQGEVEVHLMQAPAGGQIRHPQPLKRPAEGGGAHLLQTFQQPIG